MASRLVLTIIFVVIMGVSIERIIEWSDKEAIKSLYRIGGEDYASI